VFADPVLLHNAVDVLEGALGGVEFDKIVGLEARGFLFGVPLAYKMKKPFVPIRKAGKLGGECVRVSYDL
jgi:adenine phosphoribosyltransferase